MDNEKEINNVTTAFTLPQSLFDKVKFLAAADDRTISHTIRRIVSQHFEKN